MYYNKDTTAMKRRTYIVFAFIMATLPVVSFAYVGRPGNVGPLGGPYVPVYDQTTNSNFVDYISNFKDYVTLFEDQIGVATPNGRTDSLRDLISGSNPGGLAAAACAQGNSMEGDNSKAFAYPLPGNWAKASASSSGALPLTVPKSTDPHYPFVQINYSHSIRCLLQETVEWQKLGLSLQIHSLLKNYIADAQTKQLNNQLKNKIAAANLDWARSGNQVNDGGVLTSQPVFSTNVSTSKYNVKNRQLEHLTDQMSADPGSGNPVGTMGIAAPWRLDVAANTNRNSRGFVQDPFEFDQNVSQEGISPSLDPNDFGKFMLNFNDPANKENGMTTFDAMLSERANSPLGSFDLGNDIAQNRIANQQRTTEQKQTSSGFVPATQYGDPNPADPYNLDQQFGIDANPAGQNQQMTTDMASQGDRQVEQSQTLDAKGGPAAEVQSTALNTGGGVLTYDTNPLATSSTAVNQLVQEVYDVMGIGYWGIHQDTTNWARATMLMIYDEMKFNDSNTNTIVTKGTAPLDTGY